MKNLRTILAEEGLLRTASTKEARSGRTAGWWPSVRLMGDREKKDYIQMMESFDYRNWEYDGRKEGRYTGEAFRLINPYFPEFELLVSVPHRHSSDRKERGWSVGSLELYDDKGKMLRRESLGDKLDPASRHQDDRHAQKFLLDVSAGTVFLLVKAEVDSSL